MIENINTNENICSKLTINESKYLELPLNENEEYKICSICKEDMKDICLLRCNHVLCLNCIIKWMKENKSCPFCRLDLSDIELEPNQSSQTSNNTRCDKMEKVICYSSILSWVFYILINYGTN